MTQPFPRMLTMLPPPRAKLAGCLWLPRIVSKARFMQINRLPSENAARFCHPEGVDGYFLRAFDLTKEDILDAAARHRSDMEIAAWFRALPGMDLKRIARWNTLAENLGKPGYPMAERFVQSLATVFPNIDPLSVESIFDLITADESDEVETPVEKVEG